jgi:hypothetical protein
MAGWKYNLLAGASGNQLAIALMKLECLGLFRSGLLTESSLRK